MSYLGSFTTLQTCPELKLPEYAFIGRSNVGKSSLINFLANRKNMARTSKSPGKTQAMNYYLIDKSWCIVDLPGYGYAKVSKTKRRQWQQMIERYLGQRENLQVAFILVDSSINPQEIDIEFINLMGRLSVPYVIVFTKTDKAKDSVVDENISKFKSRLHEYWEDLPQTFITSSIKKEGNEPLMDFIKELNEQFTVQ